MNNTKLSDNGVAGQKNGSFEKLEEIDSSRALKARSKGSVVLQIITLMSISQALLKQLKRN